MPYVLTKNERYIHLDWSGTITPSDLKSIGKDLTKVMAEWGFAPHVLHSFDQVEGMDFGPWVMFMHSLRREDTKLPNKSKSAHVAKSEKARSICKMFRELNRNPTSRCNSSAAKPPPSSGCRVNPKPALTCVGYERSRGI